MSPTMCSHSGLMLALTASIAGETSVSVSSNQRLRWDAVLPPPASELERRFQRPDDVLTEHAQDERGIVGVVRGWRQEVEPRRKLLAVEVRLVRVAHGSTVPARSPAC